MFGAVVLVMSSSSCCSSRAAAMPYIPLVWKSVDRYTCSVMNLPLYIHRKRPTSDTKLFGVRAARSLVEPFPQWHLHRCTRLGKTLKGQKNTRKCLRSALTVFCSFAQDAASQCGEARSHNRHRPMAIFERLGDGWVKTFGCYQNPSM